MSVLKLKVITLGPKAQRSRKKKGPPNLRFYLGQDLTQVVTSHVGGKCKNQRHEPSLGVEGHTCLTNRWIALWSGTCTVPKDRGTNRNEGRCALFLLLDQHCILPLPVPAMDVDMKRGGCELGSQKSKRESPLTLMDCEIQKVVKWTSSICLCLFLSTLSLSFWVIWVSAVGNRHDHGRSGLEDRSRRIVHRPAVQ